MLRSLIGLLLITLVTTEGKQCKRGTRVQAGDGCNTCICLGHGELAGCTLRDCKPLRRRYIREVSEENKTECTPGERFSPDGGCNFCTCNEKGQAVLCSSRICYRHRLDKVKDSKSSGKIEDSKSSQIEKEAE